MRKKNIISIVVSLAMILNCASTVFAIGGSSNYDGEALLGEESNIEINQEIESNQQAYENEDNNSFVMTGLEVEDEDVVEGNWAQTADESDEPLFTNTTPQVKISFPEEARRTSQKGTTSVTYIDGFSFSDLDGGIEDYGILIYPTWSPTVQIDKIVIPPLYTTKGQSGLHIIVTGLYSSFGRDHVVPPTHFENNEPIILTHERMTNTGEPGEYPNWIRILFEIDGDDWGKMNELVQTAPIEVHFSTISHGEDPLRPIPDLPKAYYQYITYINSWTNSSDDVRFEERFDTYTFFNTLDVNTTVDKQDNLKPGDKIEVTFDVSNQSEYVNRFQNLGFTCSGLEPISENSKFVQSNDGENYEMRLRNDSGTFLNFYPLNEPMSGYVAGTTVTETFLVTEDALINPITIQPYTFFDNFSTYRFGNEKLYHDPVEFNLPDDILVQGLEPITEHVFSKVDLLKDVKFLNHDKDISNLIKIYDENDVEIKETKEFTSDAVKTYTVNYKAGEKSKSYPRQIKFINDAPTITGASAIKTTVGETVDLLQNVTASDIEEGDLTSKLKVLIDGSPVDASYLASNTGTYTIEYTVEDFQGEKTTEKTTLTVVSDKPDTPDKPDGGGSATKPDVKPTEPDKNTETPKPTETERNIEIQKPDKINKPELIEGIKQSPEMYDTLDGDTPLGFMEFDNNSSDSDNNEVPLGIKGIPGVDEGIKGNPTTGEVSEGQNYLLIAVTALSVLALILSKVQIKTKKSE